MGLDKWTTTKPHPTKALSYHAVAYGNAAGNDQFVVVGPVSIVRSQDEGASWINDTITTAPDNAKNTKSYSSVAYGGGVFVAVGSHKFRWDGMNWSEQLSQTVGGATKWLRAIAYGTVGVGGPNSPKRFGLFVAVGDAGTIVTSLDGVTWATNNSVTTDTFKTIAYGNQRFVAAAESGKIFTSPDGANWTHVTSTASYFRALTFGNNVFVGVLDSKRVLKSSDGASWTDLMSTGLANALINSINYGFDTFIVVGGAGSIYTSVDGVAWAKRLSGSNDELLGIAYGKNRFVAVGAGMGTGGDIVRSDEFPSADLSALTSSAGPLTPGFSPLLTTYRAELARNVNVATVTPTSEDPQATIRVRFDSGSDVIVASGATSAVGEIRRGFRSHTFYITVTARNNATKVYTLQVNKAPPIPIWLSWFWPFRWPA
jgi:hypothetical protein